jgi:hypothetical protein
MKTWFMMWMFASALVAYLEAFDDYFHDDRPWWGCALWALLTGGVMAGVPGALAKLAGLP